MSEVTPINGFELSKVIFANGKAAIQLVSTTHPLNVGLRLCAKTTLTNKKLAKIKRQNTLNFIK